MINRSFNQEDIAILNMFVPNNIASKKIIEQKLIELKLKAKICKSSTIVRDFNISQ